MAENVPIPAGLEDEPAPHYAKGEALLLAEDRLRAAGADELNSEAMAAAERGSGRYKSCAWIEEAAFIEQAAIKLCCMASIGRSGSPELFRTMPDHLGNIPSGAVIDAKHKIRLANQTVAPPCAGCYEFTEAQWEARDHLASIAIAGTMHCNLSCSYCVTYDFSQDLGGRVAPLIEAYINDGTLRPGSDISYGGGEPTFQKDFSAVAKLAVDHGIYMNVYTNATAFSPQVAEGLRREAASVICSVDAGTAATYKRIKGKDFLDKVWTNLARYAAANADKVYVKYIMMDANCSTDEIDAFIERASAARVRRIMPSINVHNNPGNDGILPPDIVRALAYLVIKTRQNGLIAETSEDFLGNFSPHARSAVLAAIGDTATVGLARAAPRNKCEPPLEIVFFDADGFLVRVLSAVAAGDDFRVVLPNPIEIGGAVPERVGLAACAALTGTSSLPANGPERGFVAALYEAGSHGPPEWAARLKDTAGYQIGMRVDPSGRRLAAIDFINFRPPVS